MVVDFVVSVKNYCFGDKEVILRIAICDICGEEMNAENFGRKFSTFSSLDGKWFVLIKAGPKVDKHSFGYDVCPKCVIGILEEAQKDLKKKKKKK